MLVVTIMLINEIKHQNGDVQTQHLSTGSQLNKRCDHFVVQMIAMAVCFVAWDTQQAWKNEEGWLTVM